MAARSSKVSLRPRRLWTTSTMCLMRSSRYRCDILIMLLGASPVHIPTAEEFYSPTLKLKGLLLCMRAKNALARTEYISPAAQSFRCFMNSRYLEQSRGMVWWRLTLVLCSLPLHAAVPIESTTTLLDPRATYNAPSHNGQSTPRPRF